MTESEILNTTHAPIPQRSLQRSHVFVRPVSSYSVDKEPQRTIPLELYYRTRSAILVPHWSNSIIERFPVLWSSANPTDSD